MDARALLESVSEAYRNLSSLEARGLAITESRDNGFNHSEHQVTFSYVVPNKTRLEQGERGMLLVSDGQFLHTLFPGPNRYGKTPLSVPHRLPGMFNPQFPYVSNASTFLFPNVGERVASAEILRRESIAIEGVETACDVVSVTYEPPPNPGPVTGTTPILFWVSAETRLVLRMEFEMTLQFPRHGEHTTRNILLLMHLSVNQTIDPTVFVFTPPADVEHLPQGGVVFGSGGGSLRTTGEGRQRIGHRQSHTWEGDTLVERSKLTLLGHEITMERRWKLSEDGAEIRVQERIESPKGPVEREFTIPLA
jgi:outer membrane lipoprotein-sorting protein